MSEDIVALLRRAEGYRGGWHMLGQAADEIERLRAEVSRLQNDCYKKCGVCEFDYGRAAPPVARSGDS